MRYKILIILILCLLRIAFPQQFLTDKSYHFSFILPPEWSYQHYDSAHSFIRFECFNRDSSAMVQLYAIKAKSEIDLRRFSSIATSEEFLGKNLGQFQDSAQISINKIDGIKKNYQIKTRRGVQINVQALMLAKENYGYILLTRCFKNTPKPTDLENIKESFTVKFPRSTLSWLLVIVFIGVCLCGFGLGLFRTYKWFEPLNWRAIAFCVSFIVICLVCLTMTFFLFSKINAWISLIASGLLIWGITELPDAKPVIEAYQTVKLKNTASAYRSFCQQYESSTRYYNDARRRMNVLMDDVIQKYKNLVAQLDTPIVQAALAMFEFIKRTDNFQVGVLYHAQNLIQDFTDRAKSVLNLNVLPANPAFSKEKNREREKKITGLIAYAFRQITPEDILSFSIVNEARPDQINFNINYIINVSGQLYCRTQENDLPDDKKTFYTGVEFKWLLEIRIPGQSDKYQLTLESKPAQQFSTEGTGTEKVYDAMADSAFQDFTHVFIEQSGLMSAVQADIKRREKAAAA